VSATPVLRQLHIYPLKSARGISVEGWPVGPRGLRYDRHWMVIDANGDFLSQREIPQMALINIALDGADLIVSAPGMPSLRIEDRAVVERVTVRLWKDVFPANPSGATADAWMSEYLGIDCAVVSFASDAHRQVDAAFAKPGDQVGFADGFSFLLLSEASLGALNGRLASPVAMERFRPNLVVAGCDAFAEDTWKTIRVGELEFEVVKPCARCSITTVDEFGERGKEPLATLARFRRRGAEVYFGQNLVHRGMGTLRLGDPVVVLR